MSQGDGDGAGLLVDYEAALGELEAAIKSIEELERRAVADIRGQDYERVYAQYHECRARCRSSYFALPFDVRETVAPPPLRFR